MKKLLKSTLVASAVAAACAVQAGTINELTTTYSKQGTAAGTDVTSANVTFTLGAEYSEGDVLVLSLASGATDASFDAFPDSVTAGSAGQSVTFGVLTSDASSITYRVTNVDNADNLGTTGLLVEFGAGVEVDGAAIAALSAGASVDVCAVATTGSGGVTIDFDQDCEEVALVADQINNITVSETDMFDGVIDVTQAREVFTGGTTDTVTIMHDQVDTTGWQNVVTEGDVTVTLTGDFTGLTVGQFTTAGTATLAEDSMSLEIVYPNSFTTDTIQFTSDGVGSGVTLIKQGFEVSGEQAYMTGGETYAENLGSADAGEWTLNGADINIPYMPFDNLSKSGAERALSQIIYVTNHGAQEGEIFVTARDEAGNLVLDNVAAGTLGSYEMVKLAGTIQDMLAAEDEALTSTAKYSIDITVNAPDEDVTVYAAYKSNTDTDRALVITDQYKNTSGM